MDIFQNSVLKKLDILEKKYKKVLLLEKKEERMGITDEEESLLKSMRADYYLLYDEMVDELAHFLVNRLMSQEAKKSLLKIQELVPWKGGAVLSESEYFQILGVASKLQSDEIAVVEKNLRTLHREVFKAFENFISTENGQQYCIEMAKTISFGQYTDVLTVIDYLDLRYREFADLLNIKLEEVRVVIEDE